MKETCLKFGDTLIVIDKIKMVEKSGKRCVEIRCVGDCDTLEFYYNNAEERDKGFEEIRELIDNFYNY